MRPTCRAPVSGVGARTRFSSRPAVTTASVLRLERKRCSSMREWVFLTARVCAAATAWLLLILALGAVGIMGDRQTDLALIGIPFVALVMWRTPDVYRPR